MNCKCHEMSTLPPRPSCLKRPFYPLIDNCLKIELFLKMEAEYDIIKKKTLFTKRDILSPLMSL